MLNRAEDLPWYAARISRYNGRFTRYFLSPNPPDAMAAAKDQPIYDTSFEVDLKQPYLAALLAWLVPGLGHLYQGRTGKGVLFFVCIVGTFVYGLYIGEGRVVYASAPNPLARWQYICQLGAGLPALPAIVQRQRYMHGQPPMADYMRPPQTRGNFTSVDESGNEVVHPNELAKWHHDLGDRFEMGTVFTVVAGLLNLLAIYDAYGGPLVILPREEEKEDASDSDQQDNGS